MSGFFDGSWNGDPDSITANARLECRICWYVYDPVLGDECWQIPPGTPFAGLPDSWRCPQCDGGRNGFMVLAE